MRARPPASSSSSELRRARSAASACSGVRYGIRDSAAEYADGSLASGVASRSASQLSSYSRPASVIEYTVRSGRRPSRVGSPASTRPAPASRLDSAW